MLTIRLGYTVDGLSVGDLGNNLNPLSIILEYFEYREEIIISNVFDVLDEDTISFIIYMYQKYDKDKNLTITTNRLEILDALLSSSLASKDTICIRLRDNKKWNKEEIDYLRNELGHDVFL